MGLILDSSILVESERRGEPLEDLLRRVSDLLGPTDVGISAVTVVELTHGMYRARDEAARKRREDFGEGIFKALSVYPVSFEAAKLAGQIEGREAARGIVLPFADLLIGATALHLGHSIVTLNLADFKRIPGLDVISL